MDGLSIVFGNPWCDKCQGVHPSAYDCDAARANLGKRLLEMPVMKGAARPLLTEYAPMSDDKATMTLNLTQREMAVVEQLADEHDLSKTALIRQALRLYQLCHERTKAGEKMSFSGDQQRVVEFIGPGFGQ